MPVFIPFQVFSGKISSEMEHFKASRDQRFFCHQLWWEQGLGSSDNHCNPEPCYCLVLPKFKTCINPCLLFFSFLPTSQELKKPQNGFSKSGTYHFLAMFLLVKVTSATKLFFVIK